MYTLKSIAQDKEKFIAGTILILFTAFLLVQVWKSNQNKHLPDHNSYLLKAYFRQVEGITTGSKVKLGGIPVGYVKELRLRPDRNFSVEVTVSVDQKLKIPSDSILAIQTNGIIGEKHVEIEVGGDDEILKPDDKFVYTSEALIMDDLIDKVLDLAKSSQKKMVERKAQEIIDQKKGSKK